MIDVCRWEGCDDMCVGVRCDDTCVYMCVGGRSVMIYVCTCV